MYSPLFRLRTRYNRSHDHEYPSFRFAVGFLAFKIAAPSNLLYFVQGQWMQLITFFWLHEWPSCIAIFRPLFDSII